MNTSNNYTTALANNSVQAQRARLLAYLKKHGKITTIRAKEFLNIYDPPARKFELCHDYGYNITTSWVNAVNAQGFTHRVGLYVLEHKEKE